MIEELEVYREGLVYCSVCTNIKSKERIKQLVNQKNPTGLGHGWKFSEDKTFASGHSNPCPCEHKPKTHKHYLMVC